MQFAILNKNLFDGLFQGVTVDAKHNIVVDEFQNTCTKGIYALGDVCGKALLTPGKVKQQP